MTKIKFFSWCVVCLLIGQALLCTTETMAETACNGSYASNNHPTLSEVQAYCSAGTQDTLGRTVLLKAPQLKNGRLEIVNSILRSKLVVPVGTKEVCIQKSIICDGIEFPRSETIEHISIVESQVASNCTDKSCAWGTVRAEPGLRVQGRFEFDRSSAANVWFPYAEFESDVSMPVVKACKLSLFNSKLDNLDLSYSHIGPGDLTTINDKCYVDLRQSNLAGNIQLLGTKVDGNFSANRSSIAGHITAQPYWPGFSEDTLDSIQVGQNTENLHCHEKGSSRFLGLDFRYARVGGDFRLLGTCVGSPTSAYEENLKCSLRAVEVRSNRSFLISRAKIGGDLVFAPYRFAANTKREGLVLRTIAENLAACLDFLDVSGEIALQGLTTSSLSLNYSKASTLNLYADGQALITCNNDPDSTAVDLTRSEFDQIVGSKLLGRFPSRTRFKNMKPTLIYLFREEGTGKSDLLANAQDVEEWLAQVDYKLERRAPYRMFAQALESIDRQTEADDLKYLAEIKESRHSSIHRRVGRFLLVQLGGFGLNPFRPMTTLLLFVAIGMVVFSRSKAYLSFCKEIAKERRLRFVSRVLVMFFFSLDRFIPLFSLSDRHAKVDFEGEPRVRNYFLFHALMGWAMAAVVAAALSKLISMN